MANFIMNDSEKVLYMTVSELASASKVSDASVIRFVKDLGYDSFQQLKIALAKEREDEIDDKDITISKDDSVKEIIEKTKLSCIKAIDDTNSIVDIKKLEDAARAISEAKRVEVYGVGTSAAVAMVIQYKLIRLGIPCKAYDDPHIQAMSASTMNFGDVAIGVSHTGSTKDTVDSLKIAKEHGAFTISITDHPKSPIAKYSDVVLETFSRETPVKSGAGRSIVAQIFLIEVLVGLLYSLDPKKAEKYGEESAKAVSDKLY
ncbi:MAG: MurR/RpiR family transcriptional regulator [Athalassotoga sp.]|uniref:MurR/RpiR family transcriptional regulator n=1 Tax=Athalassotoga sp. TaxID=2022597 RepID=UPI003D003862